MEVKHLQAQLKRTWLIFIPLTVNRLQLGASCTEHEDGNCSFIRFLNYKQTFLHSVNNLLLRGLEVRGRPVTSARADNPSASNSSSVCLLPSLQCSWFTLCRTTSPVRRLPCHSPARSPPVPHPASFTLEATSCVTNLIQIMVHPVNSRLVPDCLL